MICPLLVSSDALAVVGSTPIPIPGRSLPSTATYRTVGRVGCSLEVASLRRLAKKRGHSTFPPRFHHALRRRTMICPLLVSSDAHAVVGSTPIPIPGRSLPSTATGRTDDRVECSLEVASPRRLSAARSRASVILLGVGLAMRPPSACNLLGSSPGWTNANPRLARPNSHAADCARYTAAPQASGRHLESETP